MPWPVTQSLSPSPTPPGLTILAARTPTPPRSWWTPIESVLPVLATSSQGPTNLRSSVSSTSSSPSSNQENHSPLPSPDQENHPPSTTSPPPRPIASSCSPTPTPP